MFLLLQTDIGAAEAMAVSIASLDAVDTAVVTSGPYDVIVHVASEDPQEQAAVCAHVRQLSGLSRLCICHSRAEQPAARSSWTLAIASNA